MWGNIVLDAMVQPNFSIGFSTLKTDTLLHLSQWQYWWWFWFSFVWSMYFFFITSIIKRERLAMRPKINTSFRSHGKWGDFLAAIIPATWCANIIINSNFILKMLEWQTESSSFTLRIRARQWYWVYKIDLHSFFSVLECPKNVGRNKWLLTNPSTEILMSAELLQTASWMTDYWISHLTNSNVKPTTLQPILEIVEKKPDFPKFIFFSKYWKSSVEANIFFKTNLKGSPVKTLAAAINNKTFSSSIIDQSENSRWLRTRQEYLCPARILKQIQTETNNAKNNLFELRFKNSAEAVIKPASQEFHVILKQKRYRRRKILVQPSTTSKYTKSPLTTNNDKYFIELNNQKTFQMSALRNSTAYDFFSANKKRTEQTPAPLAKRLLRTKRTLVLPINFNMAIITNSFDVVHSWFIPALGLKLDCIPGRSTHHSFFLEQAGFYYGQCAEICGRYHHHMPIRVCGLPFDHYLAWWQAYALPKAVQWQEKTKNHSKVLLTKYSW